jgi:hypothetical protein
MISRRYRRFSTLLLEKLPAMNSAGVNDHLAIQGKVEGEFSLPQGKVTARPVSARHLDRLVLSAIPF